MNKIANISLLVVAVVVAVAAEQIFVTPELVQQQPTSNSLKGRVISVEAASPDRPGLGWALVKLNTGETVSASVPGGCLVLPGQVTSLAKYGTGSRSSYVVTESGKNDS